MAQQGAAVPEHGRGGILRWIVDVVGGFVLLGVGALLCLILFPEWGVPLILLSLGLLGRHYAWAKRGQDRVHRWEHEVEHWWKQLPRAARVALGVAVVAAFGLLIWWLLS
jgi:hypothetical protein